MFAQLFRFAPYAVPAMYGAELIYKHFIAERVTPKIGSVVYVSLAGPFAEHTGIYIGDGRIVQRNGNGLIEVVDETEFLRKTTGIEIYVSCNDDDAVGSHIVANRAIAQIGNQVKYSFYNKNCHQFVASCLTGNLNTEAFLFTQIKHLVEKNLAANNWLIWDRK